MNIRHNILKVSLFVGGLFAFSQGVNASNEVTVHINSGNPKFPFPQFVPYAYGASHKLENLGTKNPEGVVHAEMEQDIRDAYQIFANEWTYTGEEFGGVKYIRGNIGCPYDCREGDGYSLLAAAIMGDKTSFDGLWMRVHDETQVKRTRYIDGVVLQSDYAYGDYTTKDNSDAATDGDVDIALALYIAWRQWGDEMGINDFKGNPISYRQAMLDVIHGLVHLQTRFPDDAEPRRYVSGDIGLDGYLKGGNTGPGEITNYATQHPLTVDGVQVIPEFPGSNNVHSDYLAPAYFDEFFNLLDELKPSEITEFEKNQFKRCAASSDWIVGNWIGQSDKNIFVGEECTVDGDKVTLHAGNQGGRFRSPWRTALNYMWHGNPTYTWDPNTCTVSDGGNTFEYDASLHYSQYMNDPQGWDPSSECTKFGGPLPLTFKGPSTLQWDVQPDGSYVSSEFTFNWIPGCGMPSAVNTQDLDLLGLLYRECDIEWDVSKGNDGYLSSVPVYFHGWFRLLGMLVATGNHIAPSQMATPKPNLKIYRSIEDSLSFAYTGDEFTYYLDYRNYGTVDASGTKIVENVPDDFEFVSASDGGVYDASTHTVTWNIGTVPGFVSDDVEGPAMNLKATNLAKTMGQVSYKVRVGSEAFGRYCTTADITCTNGDGWTSNEYPNFITATMQRSCVDVIKRALKIEKKADREKVNPGNTVTYTVNFENSSEAGWLDGGRPRVNIGFANSGKATTSQQWLKFRLYNDAIEPYINYGNYRISYYMYDSNLKCVTSDDDCPVGWGWYTAVYEGKRSTDDKIKVSHETIVEGSDEKGHWNQRMSLQFSPLLVTTSAHISNYYGMGARIHKGGTETLRAYGYIFPSTWSDSDFGDDWSWDANAGDTDDGVYFPVTPSWQEIDPTTGKSIEKVVDEYIPSACETPTHTIDNILVEEYDGYTWRRILGNGPMAGREAENVVVIDTLPKGMTFVAFQNNCPLSDYGASWDSYKIADGRWVVKWEIPLMQVKQKGSIIYTAEAHFPSGKECETEDEETMNIAWISADLNSPISDTAIVTVTCAKVPDPIIPTTLTKVADKEVYAVGDDITYTIGYKQTHGAILENAGASTSDWTLSGATLSNGTLTVPDKGTAKYNKSYSKDSYIELNCNLTTYASTEIVLRDKIKLDVKLDWATLNLTCYDGSVLKKEASIVYQSSTPLLRLQLRDNILQVWLDNDTTNSASFIVDDLTTVTPGCLGFNGIEAGNFSFSNIYVHTDYAYDLSIVDRVPAEVTVDEGSFKAYHNGTLAGVGKYYKASSASAQDSIVFTGLADNPIAFNDTFTVEWSGTVNACEESIINIAYAKLLGHADNEIMAQVVTGCGATTCPLSKVTLKSAATSFCETDSMLIKATATSKDTYTYQWYNGKTKIGTATEGLDTLWVKESGDYWVKVSYGDDATCVKNSDTLTLAVDTIPATILKDTSACPDTDVELPSVKKAEDTFTYEWSDGSTDETLTVSKEGTYSVTVTNGTCVAKDTAEVSFKGVTLGDGIFTLNTTEYDRAVTDTGSICPNTTATLKASYESDDNKYEWSSKPEDPNMKSDGSNTITIAPTETTTYYVNLTKGCAAVDSFVVTIGGVKLSGGVFTLNDMEYDRAKTDTGSICPNTTATLAVSYKADGDAYEWSSSPADANLKSDGSNTITIAPTAMTTYYVKFKQECDAIDSFVVTIGGVKLSGGSFTLNTTEYPRSEGNSGSVCPNTENTLTVSYKSDDGNYTWSSEPKDETMSASGATVTISPKEKTMYFVDFVLGCAARDSFEVTIGEPMKVTVKTDTLCNSLKLTASTDDSEKATFTWTKDGETSTANPLAIDGTTDPSGKVSVVATATDACESEPVEVSYQNVDMTVKIDGSATVCPGKTASLAAVVETTGLEGEPEYTYSWSDGTAEVGTEATYAAPAGSYSLTVSNGYCEKSATHEITEGTGEVKGDLTINDTKIVGSGADRTYGSCGGDLVIVADYTHDAGTDFTWTVNGETQSATGNTITISPKEATTVTIDFMNECAAHDEFTITMLDSVKLTTEETRKCGSTTLSVSSNVAGATYTWTNGTEETSGKSLTIDLAQAPTAGGSVKVQGTAAGYCDSKIEEVTYLIDTLGVTLAGPETVCDGATAALTATAATSNTDATVTYSYASRKAGSTTAFAPMSGTTAELTSGALTEDTEFQVTADNGTCTATATWTVKIGIPTRDGQLTVDGQATTLTDKNGTKTYRTCGDADIALAVSHTGESFVWTKDGASVGEGASVSVTPATATNHTETYIVTYTNQCPVSDTVNVEVYPLSATADWSLVDGKEYCEGADASATLTLSNYDATLAGSYIKWFKDGAEITAANGKTTLSLTGLKTTDAGTYTYEVSNGICTRPNTTDEATMKVDAKLHLSVATDEMIVAKGEAASVEVTADPANTTLTWYDDATGTRTSAGTGNPLALASVDRDYQLTAVGEAENYCPDSVKVSVLADAKAVVVLSAEAPYICYTGGDVLTIDTTGTGTVRFPAKYRISLQESADGTTYTEIANNVTTYKVSPNATTSYKAVVTYGDQTAESEVVTVNFYPAATFTVDAPAKVCTGTEAQINLVDLTPADAEVVWNTADGISGSGTSATATPTQTSVYGYSIQQNGGLCVENFSVGIITVDQLELFAQDTTICAGGSATLHAVASQTPEYYKWFEGDSLVSEKATLFAKPTETTTYKVRVSNGYCDSVEVSATVTVSELPVIDTVISMAARQVQVVAHGGMEPYEYAVKPHDYSDSELVDLTTYGRHTFMVRDQYGCVGTKDVTIDAPEIKVPEIVTNNGDGINDDFTVPGLAEAYPDATVTIYDRWGKKLVEYSASEGSWDGTYNGKQMPSTDYWYEIWIPELYKYYTGHFTLLND